MKSERPVYRTFLKFYSERYLIGGSTRTELDPAERGVWIDVLCLANRLDGVFEIFNRDDTAAQLRISRELLDRAIDKFLKYKKLRRAAKTGEKRERFYVINWERYQYGGGDRIAKTPKRESQKGQKPQNSEPTRLDRIGLDRIGQDKDRIGLDEDGIGSDQNEEKSSHKKHFFKLLQSFPSYPFQESEDGGIFDLFAGRYPKVDVIGQTALKIDWWKKNPAAMRAKDKTPRQQLVDWLLKEVEFRQGR